MTNSMASTPTVEQFLDAADAEYSIGGVPPGMTPFDVNGKQVSMTDILTGVSASVWETASHQLIVAYQGTSGGYNLLIDPEITATQVLNDIGNLAGQVTPSEREAAAFANQVVQLAAQQGISSNNIFLTGHSLGGTEAEYAAQQTGLGGMAFEPTGIPKSATAKGDGSNFVDVVTYGDPWGNYSSDIQGEQPFAPAYAPGQSGSLPHYGNVLMIGNPADQQTLSAAASLDSIPIVGFGLSVAAMVPLFVGFHLPGEQAYDLGVTLPNYTAGLNNPLIPDSQPLHYANYTIPQVIAASHGHS